CDGGGSGAPAAKRIGVSLLTQQHDFYKDLEAGMRAAAAEAGYELIVMSAEFDAARQATQLENFVTQRVAAAVICPCDSTGVVQAIGRLNRAGIPVFTADIAAGGGDVVCHVASDNVQGGRLAASTLAMLLDREGDVIVIDHPEVSSVQERVAGFLEEMERWPGIRIIDRPSAGGMRDKAFAVTQDKLQANPQLRGIFAINDDSALGALSALSALGNRDVVIVGYDATAEARQEILRGGPLKADVVQHPRDIGRRTIEVVERHISSGGSAEIPRKIPVPVGIVDRPGLRRAGEK
ncbi:MAG: substrate-binding domain-containing protein, partial [Planctomycetota bacterium]